MYDNDRVIGWAITIVLVHLPASNEAIPFKVVLNTSQHMSSQTPVEVAKNMTTKQVVIVGIVAFLIPILGILFAVNFLSKYLEPSRQQGADVYTEQAVAERIQPIGRIEVRPMVAAGVIRTGEEVFKQQCSTCHSSGLLGSPKFQDAAAWGPRIAKGYDELLTSALKGKGNMTAQGGGQFSDYEVGRAVVYMANAAGAKFSEPKAPAAASGAASQ